jgi:uncharacterized membrane protein (DUF2068 family)
MDWSLLGCGARGHVTFAPDEPGLRERFSTTTRDGPAWRCLRCGTFVIGPPKVTGPATGVPRVRRDKELRSAFILRVFAVERYLRAILFAGLAVGAWRFDVSRLTVEQAYDRELPAVRTLLRQLGFNVYHNHLLGLINRAFTLDSRTLALLAILAATYSGIEVIEGTGLWLLKRWGEYFAMVATSVFIPYEIYDLVAKVTVIRLGAFLVNLALVVYLVLAKRLFGVRGGKKAYDAALRSESILDAELAAVAAGQPGPVRQPESAGQPEPAGPAGPGTATVASDTAAASEAEAPGTARASSDGEAAGDAPDQDGAAGEAPGQDGAVGEAPGQDGGAGEPPAVARPHQAGPGPAP